MIKITSFKQLKPKDVGYTIENFCITNNFSIISEINAHYYIDSIEKEFGGKLNMETLEIEKSKSEKSRWISKSLDYVLSNDNSDKEWTICQFSHIDKKGNMVFVGGSYANKEKVIPYNDETAHLVGTTDNYEEY